MTSLQSVYPTAEHPKSCLHIRGARLAPSALNQGPTEAWHPQISDAIPHLARGSAGEALGQPYHPAERVQVGQEMGLSTKANGDLLVKKLNTPPPPQFAPFASPEGPWEVLAE